MSEPRLYAEARTDLAYCCGVDEIGDFRLRQPIIAAWGEEGPPVVDQYPSGTGLFIATFNSKQRKELAAFRKVQHKVLYESPWKKNVNSGNRVKLFVMMHKKPRAKKQA